MTERKGNISVSTQDIFPIIKKWLYSEHDIFVRELVANATDAISKRITLGRTRNTEIPDGKVTVMVDADAKTVQFTDNGLGMTESDVEKYIAQLAFSGAEEFVEKMKEAGDDAKDIIGKFGLGFYSSFMVADKVQIDSLSMEEGSKATRWTCEGDTEFEFSDSDRKEVGTTVTLYINEESSEFLQAGKLAPALRNFCDFMPYPITILDLKRAREDEKKEKKEGEETYSGEMINDTQPIWKRDPSELTDDDYKSFFRRLYPMDGDPLFWIHLRVDHPFTLEGILYFPKLNPTRQFQENNIRLYSKQVFVSSNVKDVIPEFLSLLKGCIDSVDIPLNVSRSSLQGDPNIRKISNYVIKKVAESLKKLYKNDRARYDNIWEDIGIFVKYGCVSDTKFDELMRDKVLFKNSDAKHITLDEYRESVPEKYKEKMKDLTLYFEKDRSDVTLRKQLLTELVHAIETDDQIDPHFMQHCETQKIGDSSIRFASVDSEIANILETENATAEDTQVKELFQKVLVGEVEKKDDKKEEAMDPASLMNPQMDIEIQKIKNSTAPAYFKTDEQMKRFSKMAKAMGQNAAFPVKKTLVINPSNPLIQNALKLFQKGDNEQLVEKLCHHVEDLANISSEGLKMEDKDLFIQRSQDLLQDLTNHLTL